EIINCSSAKSDIKGFSIQCHDTIDQVVDGLRELFGKIIDLEIDDNIVFTDEKCGKATHRIKIQRSGTAENYRKSTKNFSIYFPNFGSSEIVSLLVEKIQGGVK
ncbi:MAG: hypothetical protein ACTSWQ_03715, partial [Candidatus Thorarchaeota archaeon]